MDGGRKREKERKREEPDMCIKKPSSRKCIFQAQLFQWVPHGSETRGPIKPFKISDPKMLRKAKWLFYITKSHSFVTQKQITNTNNVNKITK